MLTTLVMNLNYWRKAVRVTVWCRTCWSTSQWTRTTHAWPSSRSVRRQQSTSTTWSLIQRLTRRPSVHCTLDLTALSPATHRMAIRPHTTLYRSPHRSVLPGGPWHLVIHFAARHIPSVTLVNGVKTDEHIINFFTVHALERTKSITIGTCIISSLDFITSR